MKLNILLLLLLFLLLITVSACNASKRASYSTLKEYPTDYIKKQLIQNQINADWLSARAKVKLRSDAQNMTVFSNVRLKKDSVIWLNAKAFGIEAGRVLIRPDSLFLLDRLNKRYMAKDIWWLQDEFGLPVNFQGLQAMLLGNPVFYNSNFTVANDSLNYTLAGENDKYSTQYIVSGATFKLLKMLLIQPKYERAGIIELSNYQEVEGSNKTFSFSRNIEMNSPESGTANINIEMYQVELNKPVKMPFVIPKQYSKMR